MSRSRRLRRFIATPGFSRRRLLKTLLAGSALPLLSACGGDSPAAGPSPEPPAAPPSGSPGAPTPSFKHGVASGDPLPDRVILWSRVSGLSDRTPFRWELAEDAEFKSIVRQSPADADDYTDASRDYTLKVDADGLAPGRSYWYRFSVFGVLSPVGRTRTAPAGSPERVRLALVSCSNFATGYFNAYQVLARRELDAVLHVGDYFYEGGGAGSLGRANVPDYEILSLADYRTRHALYRSDPDLQAMTAAHPLIAVWDDHESTNNSWAEGAGNHQPDTEGEWAPRMAASTQAYAEWLPIRLPEPGNPQKIWRRFAYGDLVDLFMLDTRLQRNAPETDTSITGTGSYDPDRTMLGLDQRDWLLAGMQASAAAGTRWRVLGQQTMMSPHRNNPDPRYSPLPYLPPEVAEAMGLRLGGGNEGGDNWGAYAAERDLLMKTWRDQGIANNIVLAGDIHTAWACDVVEDPYTPFNPLSPALTGVPGYNPLTGQGAVAVEFTCMSVTSNNMIDDPQTASLAPFYNAAVVAANPNVQYHNAAAHGFVLVELRADRAVGEFWNVGSVLSPFGAGDDAVLDAAWEVRHGEPGAVGCNHLRRV